MRGELLVYIQSGSAKCEKVKNTQKSRASVEERERACYDYSKDETFEIHFIQS